MPVCGRSKSAVFFENTALFSFIVHFIGAEKPHKIVSEWARNLRIAYKKGLTVAYSHL